MVNFRSRQSWSSGATSSGIFHEALLPAKSIAVTVEVVFVVVPGAVQRTTDDQSWWYQADLIVRQVNSSENEAVALQGLQ